MERSQVGLCPSCQFSILHDYYFCPHCGKQLKERAIQVSALKQVGIYLFSFFLAPFGLIFAIKYIKQPDPKTKLVGWIALGITIIAVSLTIFVFKDFFVAYMMLLNQLSTGQFTGFSL